jgi:hypothetical protein
MRHQRFFRKLARRKNHVPSANSLGLSRIDLTILSLLLLLLLSTAVYARADDQIRAVRLSNVVGSVQILSGTETQFSQAYPNMPLMQGSTLKTGEDGRAEVQFEDGSVVRLTPNSSVAMTVLGRDSSGNTNTGVDLLTGLSYVEMKGKANQKFVVHFGSNEVVSAAPVKFRVSLDANPNEFAVLDGTAHLTSGSAYAVDVRANETVRFDASDSGRYFLAQGVDPDSWDQWNVDRDQAMSQMAAQETREAIGSGNEGAAGVSDLDYYGNWYASNGTSFWMPDGAGAGWDPYGLGYWGNYGGSAGFVWISGYPWGWLPYHCGTWNYFNSFNSWGWIPGGGCLNNTWYPVGGYGNVPPRYRPLPRPMPVAHPTPGGGFHPPVNRSLIAVDRGPEATTLTPHLGVMPRTIGNGGESARLLSKTPNPTVLASGRPGSPPSGRVENGFHGGEQIGSAPVYRPTSPSPVYRGAAPPSYGGHPSGGSISASHPSFSSSSAASSLGASHASSGGGAPSSPAPSAGGGHPR